MPLKTLVKVGTITNLSDARYCAGMGVEMLGFCAVEGSENYISPKAFQEIRGWLSGPSVVIEIYGLKKEDLLGAIENYAPAFLELDVDDLTILLPDVAIPLILKTDEASFLNRRHEIVQFKDKIAYILLNQSECSGHFINATSSDFSVLLAPQEESEILKLLASSNIEGIALNGSQEIKPGLKDYDRLANVLEQLEID